MKAKTIIAATTTVALLGIGGAALAEQASPRGPHVPPLFLRLDRDHDRALEKAEVLRPREERFAKLDANGDGRITADELDAHLKQRLQRRLVRMRYRMLARLDADGDGVISKREFTARAMRRFARIDLNGDGRVVPEELRAARKLHRKRMRARWRKHARRMWGERPARKAE